MNEAQDPMTGFKTLELAFSQGWRMRRVPFTEDMYFEKDQALGAYRYTYARLDKLKVQQTVVLNGNEPLDGLPCFCLFYGTHENLRGKGLTIPFIKSALDKFNKEIYRKHKEYYIEAMVDHDNQASLAVATKLFGDPVCDGADPETGEKTIIWQSKVTN